MTDLRPVPDELLTRQQFADYLQVGIRTVDQWRHDGMPVVLIGPKLIRIRVADATRWLETLKRTAA